MNDPIQKSPEAVVFFDGVCGLCNFWVDQLMKLDRRGVLRFAPLQSPYARAAIDARYLEPPYSTVVIKMSDGQIFERSEGVLRCAQMVGGPLGSMFRVFALLPPRIRDEIYDRIAKNRYVWFGKRDTCRLPTPEEKERILYEE